MQNKIDSYWTAPGLIDPGDKIIQIACRVFGVSRELLFTKTRKREVVRARQLVIWYHVKHMGYSTREAMSIFNLNRSSWYHIEDTFENLDFDVEFKKSVECFFTELKAA